jgi:tripartite ATP-independent transporter DctM subunit
VVATAPSPLVAGPAASASRRAALVQIDDPTRSHGAALVAMSAVMDPLIPPSITMIVFGVLSGTSIAQMFIAGIMPGVILGFGLLAYAGWRARKSEFPAMPRVAWSERAKSLLAAMPALMLPVIIVGGVKSGIFTMTESAAVAVAYAFVVGALHRELTLARLWEALCTTAIATSGLLFILAMASIVSFALTIEEVPTSFANSLLSVSDNPYVVLLMLNIILLVLGKFLEPISVMIVTMPILIKVAQMIHMDMVQFGVMVTLNVVIGMVTPPVGVCLFVVCAIAGKSILEVSKEVLPMFFICLVLLTLVATVPAVTLWLPSFSFFQ